LTEAGAPPGYLNDPDGAEGAGHPDYGSGPLTTLANRDAFRSSLPSSTNMAAVNDLIAKGCSAAWIRDTRVRCESWDRKGSQEPHLANPRPAILRGAS